VDTSPALTVRPALGSALTTPCKTDPSSLNRVPSGRSSRERPTSSPRRGLQVADHPTSYNPLFVYGGVGLGKTHLVQAIGNHILAANPAAKIRYIHAETCVGCRARLPAQGVDDFKRHYRSLDRC
jgi:hypothetical protein